MTLCASYIGVVLYMILSLVLAGILPGDGKDHGFACA